MEIGPPLVGYIDSTQDDVPAIGEILEPARLRVSAASVGTGPSAGYFDRGPDHRNHSDSGFPYGPQRLNASACDQAATFERAKSCGRRQGGDEDDLRDILKCAGLRKDAVNPRRLCSRVG